MTSFIHLSRNALVLPVFVILLITLIFLLRISPRNYVQIKTLPLDDGNKSITLGSFSGLIRNKPAKVAFITASIGSYELTLKAFTKQTIPADFIAFTDNLKISLNSSLHNNWIIDTTPYHLLYPSPLDHGHYINSISNNNHTFNIAKYYKQAFQNIPRLQRYDVIIWIDAHVQITHPQTAEYFLREAPKYRAMTWFHDRKGILKNEVSILIYTY